MPMPFSSHCRLWDGQNMHYLSSNLIQHTDFDLVYMADSLVLINKNEPTDQQVFQSKTNRKLMVAVGKMDSQENLLYDKDIVECDGHLWVIRPDPEQGGFSLFLPQTIGFPFSLPLDDELARLTRMVGNLLEDPQLIQESFTLHLAA